MRGTFIWDKDLSLQGFPQLLKDNGYYTLSFNSKLKSKLKVPFKRQGVDHFFSLDAYVTPQDLPFKRGQRYFEDHIMYKYFYQTLDEIEQKKQSQKDKRPYYSQLITLYNHVAFEVPPSRRKIFSSPTSLKEKFINSIHLTDLSLEYFFSELKKRHYLKNSVIVITGDHGYPLGNHGISTTESGVFDESFRVPLLILWPDVLPPKRISAEDGVYSHIDIAPTLIDLLKIPVKSHHFIGQSVFSDLPHPGPILIQPFNGITIENIKYPYKYCKNFKLQKEYLYNLKEDPTESHNLISSHSIDLAPFKNEIEKAFFNHYLIKNNKVWID